MKISQPVFLIIVGMLIIIAGFMYDIFFAGIPYQDPTPEMTKEYNFHSRIAAITLWSGIFICIFGIAKTVLDTFLKLGPKT